MGHNVLHTVIWSQLYISTSTYFITVLLMRFYLTSHINKVIFQLETRAQCQRPKPPFIKLLSIIWDQKQI